MARDPRFDVNIGAEPDAPPSSPIDEQGFSVAILGDFSGRTNRGIADETPLVKRRAWAVDRDEVDDVIAKLAPRLELVLEPGGAPISVAFQSLDDFHPDRLAERLPTLLQLRALRAELAAPSNRAPQPERSSPDSAARRANAAALDLGSGSLLDRIVENEPGASESSLRGVAPSDELTDFVDRAVRGHTVQEVRGDQRELIAKVDDVLAATMRVVLHHPSFQALESLWRAVDLFVRRMDTDEQVRVWLVDVSREEVLALSDGAVPPWSVAVAAYTFGPDDIAHLGVLGEMGRRSGVSFITAADARLGGTSSFAGDPDPDEWDVPVVAGWDALRASLGARRLMLALPRFILRLPYGAKTDACTVVPFEEMPTPEHDAYLWGNPAFACALVIAQSVADGDPPATHGTIENLPLHVAHVGGEPTAKPAAEALLGQRAIAKLLDRGLTPLATSRDGDSIRLARMQSIASPAAPLPIPSI